MLVSAGTIVGLGVLTGWDSDLAFFGGLLGVVAFFGLVLVVAVSADYLADLWRYRRSR